MTTCRVIASLALLAALGACDRPDSPVAGSPAPAQPAGAVESASPPHASADAAATATSDVQSAAGPAAIAAPSFAGKVWRVVASGGVQPGTTYAFLSDGTLVIEAPPGNPPGYGRWRLDDGKLTIEEEGIAYPTDIVRNDADHLALRSHNPAGTLDIELERVPDAALPQAP